LDVRVIAATHRDLVARVADQRFRDDLFYRLNVIHIMVPPLRERRDDIPYLLRHFLETFSNMHRLPIPEITTDASHRLLAYDWPGNVRELRNAAERLVVCGGNGRVDVGALPLAGGPERRSMHVAAETPRGTTRRQLRSNREVSCVSD
jgi:DNA-binding NtrC family response regulator